uniref:Uncharacterized protein n=1 Tax=Stephanocyclus meneghinianus TaxID=29205 RepID=A0A7S1PGJ4_STEMN|mmetsp:Transcript_23/g.30  ORF Transcript_23/g.30 Transcript_23/m.30 type:complete len:170 (+) Transcript_23:106-615(+)|eukprot:scaffold287463_cov149-Cyclotella_meneghiniana.AAC.2
MMKLIASLLALPLVMGQGTNKTLAPTPGVDRPTVFPTVIGDTPEPTYELITNSPNAMSYGYEEIIEYYGGHSGKSGKSSSHYNGKSGKSGSHYNGKSGKSGAGKSGKGHGGGGYHYGYDGYHGKSGKSGSKSGKGSKGKGGKSGSKSSKSYHSRDGGYGYYRALRTRQL